MEYLNKLKDLRNKHGFSQAYIADLLETTQQHYSCYEKGTHEMPIRHLITLCKLYNVSADWILGISDEQSKPNENMRKYEVRNTLTGESAVMYFAENINIENNKTK